MNKPNFLKSLGVVDSKKYIDFIEKNNIEFEQNFKYDRRDYFGTCKNFFLVERFNINHKDLAQNFFNISKDVFKLLSDYFGNGTIYNIQFSLMPPKSEIKRHYDYGLEFSLSNRIHLPLTTNEKVLFTIGDQTFNLKTNRLVEINNKKFHSVINDSEDTRIHLIIDYLQIKYTKYLQ